MKRRNNSDPIKSLVDAARPEMDRIRAQAGLGFESRLASSLPSQNLQFWILFEAEANKCLKYATAVCLCSVVIAGIAYFLELSSSNGASSVAIERLILGL